MVLYRLEGQTPAERLLARFWPIVEAVQMRVWLFYEFAQTGRRSRPYWEAVGVWAAGEGAGIDFTYRYRSGYEEVEREAAEILATLSATEDIAPNRLFLEFHAADAEFAPDRARSPVFLTQEFEDAPAAIDAAFAALERGELLFGAVETTS